MDIHAAGVDFLALLQHFCALALHFVEWDMSEIRHAHLSNAGIGLGNVPFDFGLWGSAKEWVGQALLCCCDALLEYDYGLLPALDLSQLEIPLVGAIRVTLERCLQQFLSLVRFVIMFEDIGIAHHYHVVMRFLLIGQRVVVFCFLVVHLIVLLFAHLEQLFEWQLAHVISFVHC